tara:strand:- start:2362 stop:4113 length:1752 start_codon:yes stop_codon:yes gene_type:complete
VQIVSEHVRIKKNGQNYKGLCPFHTEKTPSFTVSPGKRIYHCFGCGAGGNIFKFLMETEGLTFVEAIRKLGVRYGVPIPETSNFDGRENTDAREREFLVKLNYKVGGYFRQSLCDPVKGKNARDYLESRSFGPDVQELYKLGWAPRAWRELLDFFAGKEGATPAQLEKAGLVKRKKVENSIDSIYDRFRGRIIFPLHDLQGNTVGFAGRLIVQSNSEPKYLNSPETTLYKKGAQLFGFYLAREHIRKQKEVLVMEGYFDQIRAYQSGICNTVATCGTALTTRQVASLKNHTDKAVLVFDSDQAGQSATDRGFEIFLEQGMQVRVLVLPPGEDPDSFILKYGKDAFLKKLENAQRFLEYFIRRAKSQGSVEEPLRRLEIINAVLPFLVKTVNAIEKRDGFQLLVDELRIEDRDLLSELKKTFEKNKPFLRPKESKPVVLKNPEEYYLVQLLLAGGQIAETIRSEISLEAYQDSGYQEVAKVFYAQLDLGEPIRADRAMDRLKSDEGKALLSRLSVSPMEFDDSARATADCIRRVKTKELEEKIKSLKKERREAEKAGETERSRHLNQLVREMQSSLNQDIRIAG